MCALLSSTLRCVNVLTTITSIQNKNDLSHHRKNKWCFSLKTGYAEIISGVQKPVIVLETHMCFKVTNYQMEKL